jgi:hypothetical protein
MSRAFSIPCRSRDESLAVTASHARVLPTDEDRDVSRQLVLGAYMGGVAETAGELLDHLASLEPHELRHTLDAARVAAGVPTTGEVEADERFRAASAAGRASMESTYQGCHATDCHALPIHEAGGLRPVNVVRWFCPEHVHLAAPGDISERPAPWRLSPSGAIVEDNAAADAAQAAAEESRRAQAEAEANSRAAEAEDLRAHERAKHEQLVRETPTGWSDSRSTR